MKKIRNITICLLGCVILAGAGCKSDTQSAKDTQQAQAQQGRGFAGDRCHPNGGHYHRDRGYPLDVGGWSCPGQ